MLTVKEIAALRPGAKEYLQNDGYGLYLRIRPDGTKHWLFIYTDISGTRRKLGLGRFEDVPLAMARNLALEKRQLLAADKDPRIDKLQKRTEARKRDLATFEPVARDWHRHETVRAEWSESYSHKQLRMLELHAFPTLGNIPFGLIQQSDIHGVLMKVSLSGTRETAIRLRESLQRIFRWAVTKDIIAPAENFMAPGVADFKLPAPRTRHHAALLNPESIGRLLRDCREYQGHFITRCALRVMPYLFQRPGQIRKMEWEQLDLDDALWDCPPEIMKMTNARRLAGNTLSHLVPLPHQVVSILGELYQLTGPSGPVFKSVSRRSEKSRYMSENTVNAALRSLGWNTQTEITGHGFRAMARTLIRERLGWDREVIERHLAHGSDEALGTAYDRTTFVRQRMEMVQAWADYLDSLERGGQPSLTLIRSA